MRIIAKSTLVEFYEKHADSKIGLLSWHEQIKKAIYETPQQLIQDFKGADFVGDNRIVFNIAKNKYRLVASFNFKFNACWIKFIGTHSQYDKIDVKTVDHI
jgi:mRNA interferase HigB